MKLRRTEGLKQAEVDGTLDPPAASGDKTVELGLRDVEADELPAPGAHELESADPAIQGLIDGGLLGGPADRAAALERFEAMTTTVAQRKEIRALLFDALPGPLKRRTQKHDLFAKKRPTVSDISRIIRDEPAAISDSGKRYLDLCGGEGDEKPTITVVIARIGGADGVWLEVEKQMEMWGAFYDFHIVAGELNCAGGVLGLDENLEGSDQALKKVTVLPELAFGDEGNKRVEQRLADIRSEHIDLATGANVHDAEMILGDIASQADALQAKLKSVIETSHAAGSNIVVTQNLQAIPMHKAAGLALHRLFNDRPDAGGVDYEGLYVLHHHDFISDRMPERYLPIVSFENVYGIDDVEALSDDDIRNCSVLLEHIRFAYGLEPETDADRIVDTWQQDFEKQSAVNMSLADDDKAARFPPFLRWLLENADQFPRIEGVTQFPQKLNGDVGAHIRWTLAHGRMSTDPELNTLMMKRVLNQAFPSRQYRDDIDYHLWTINAESGRICQQVTGKESVYFPNMFEFPRDWDSLVARLDHPKVVASNASIDKVVKQYGIEEDDKLLSVLVRVVPRKQIELAVDTLRDLVATDPDEPYKLMIIGQSGDEGVEYQEELMAKIREYGLEDRVVWLGDHVGNETHLPPEERNAFHPGQWTDYLRAHRAVEVYPSKIEGWGNRLGELAAQGVATLVHPYAVFRNTIVPDLEAAGHANPYTPLEWQDEPGGPVAPAALDQIRGLLTAPDDYDDYARQTYDTMMACYAYEPVRNRLQVSVPTPSGLESLRPELPLPSDGDLALMARSGDAELERLVEKIAHDAH